MFRSPQKLRSGTKGNPVPLSRQPTDKQDKPTDKKQRSLSASSADTQPTTTTTTMPPSDLDATVAKSVNAYLSGEDIVSKLVTRLANEMKGVIESAVQSALAAVNNEVSKLREEVKTLTEKLRMLDRRTETRSDDLEQYERRNNLRVFGVEESAGEDTDAVVTEIFRTKLGLEVSANVISRSHRVGKSTPTADGRRQHRAIIVRFVSYRERQKVYSSKKKLKGSGVTIREDLTVSRMEVYRQAVERHGPRNTWTQDGRILWLDKDGRKGVATHLEDLRS